MDYSCDNIDSLKVMLEALRILYEKAVDENQRRNLCMWLFEQMRQVEKEIEIAGKDSRNFLRVV
jgi:hypothetical protein